MKTSSRTYRRGRWSEELAAVFLMAKGYWPLAWRYKTRYGEIDLVMRRGKTIIFVEVKYRPSLMEGAHAVTIKSQQRIQSAARDFLKKRYGTLAKECRFDVVVVRPKHLPYHMPDAWREQG